jgi:hypothetical protein
MLRGYEAIQNMILLTYIEMKVSNLLFLEQYLSL